MGSKWIGLISKVSLPKNLLQGLPIPWIVAVVCAFLLGLYADSLVGISPTPKNKKIEAARGSITHLDQKRTEAHAHIDSLPVDSLQNEFDRLFPK